MLDSRHGGVKRQLASNFLDDMELMYMTPKEPGVLFVPINRPDRRTVASGAYVESHFAPHSSDNSYLKRDPDTLETRLTTMSGLVYTLDADRTRVFTDNWHRVDATWSQGNVMFVAYDE